MILIQASGFDQFFAAFGVLRAAGVEVVSSGGNEMRVPDDTDRSTLRTVSATGAVVHADVSDPAAPDPDGGRKKPDPPEEPSAEPRSNRKSSSPRTRKNSRE